MLIECLIKRDGPTHVSVAGFDYVFEKDKEGRSVCEVISSGHQAHFLELKNSFVPYKKKGGAKPQAVVAPPPHEDLPRKEAEDADILYRHDGTPYSTERAAKVAIKQRSLDEQSAEVVSVEDGFAIQVKVQQEGK